MGENRNDRIRLNKFFFRRNGKKATPDRLDRVIGKAREIEGAVTQIPGLRKVYNDVLLCLEMVRDYRCGAYEDVATWAVAAVVFGLLYLINPVELIPDFIPVIGYLDDVAILVLILKLVRAELKKYASWRKSRVRDNALISKPADHV